MYHNCLCFFIYCPYDPSAGLVHHNIARYVGTGGNTVPNHHLLERPGSCRVPLRLGAFLSAPTLSEHETGP